MTATLSLFCIACIIWTNLLEIKFYAFEGNPLSKHQAPRQHKKFAQILGPAAATMYEMNALEESTKDTNGLDFFLEPHWVVPEKNPHPPDGWDSGNSRGRGG